MSYAHTFSGVEWGWTEGGGGNYILKICFYIGVSFEKVINVYSFASSTYTSKLTISGYIVCLNEQCLSQ